jgi:23S rRNA (adenine2503-C2)-methyltransferase
LSLHASNDEKRNKIIPSSKQNSIPQLIEALKYYNANTAQRIHIEYAMFDNFNDNVDDAKNLLVFCKNFPVKINLIPYNSTTNTNFKSSSKEKIKKFASLLLEKNLVVTIRESRGSDIDAACGQLANKPK